jgi:hypothetical protein
MPPSVKSAIVVNGLILGIMLLSAFHSPAADTPGAFVAPLFVAAVHAVALVGVFTRGRWAWIYLTTILGIWELAFVVISAFSMTRLPDVIQSIPGWLVCGFLGWLFLSLALGRPARSFFLAKPVDHRMEITET